MILIAVLLVVGTLGIQVPTPDVSINIGAQPSVALIGGTNEQTISYTISNSGSGGLAITAYGLTVQALLPNELVITRAPKANLGLECNLYALPNDAGDGQPSNYWHNLTCAGSELAYNEIATVTIYYRVNQTVLGPMTVRLIGDVLLDPALNLDAQLSNNHQDIPLDIRFQVNLEVFFRGIQEVVAGNPATTWSVTARNIESRTATNVVLRVLIPQNISCLPAGACASPTILPDQTGVWVGTTRVFVDTTNLACIWEAGYHSFVCQNTIQPAGWVLLGTGGNAINTDGQGLTFTFQGEVLHNVGFRNNATQWQTGGVQEQTAVIGIVSSVEPDSGYTNNEVEYPIVIKVVSAITVVKSSSGFVYAGENSSFALTVTNNGPSDGYGVVLHDYIPCPFSYLSYLASTPVGRTEITCQLVRRELGRACNATDPYGTNNDYVECFYGQIEPGVTPRNVKKSEVAPRVGINAGSVLLTLSAPSWAAPNIASLNQKFWCEDPATRLPYLDPPVIVNIATVTSNSYDPEFPVSNVDTACLNIVDRPKVTVVKRCAVCTIVPSSFCFFKIDVSNTGPSDARGVIVTDNFNAIFNLSTGIPVKFVSINSDGSDGSLVSDLNVLCNFINQRMTCTFADPFAAGLALRLIITYTPNCAPTNCAEDSFPTPVPNTAKVRAIGALDKTYSSDKSRCNTVFQSPPDVSVIKSVTPQLICSTADTARYWYTITVTNHGPGSAAHVRLADLLNTFYMLPRTQDGEYLGTPSMSEPFAQACPPTLTTGATVDCTWALLPEGANVTLRFPFNVTYGSDTGGLPVENCAFIIATLDRDPNNNRACVNVTLQGGAYLEVTKTSRDAVVCAGESPSQFTVEVTNTGAVEARDVFLDDELIGPWNTSAVAVTSVTLLPDGIPLNVALCTITHPGVNVNALVHCNVGTLGVGQTVRVVFSYSAPSNATPSRVGCVYPLCGYANTVTVGTALCQLSTVCNASTIRVPVCANYGMTIKKRGETRVVAGGNSSSTNRYLYYIFVTNRGPADAPGPVSISDQLPLHFVPTEDPVVRSGLGTCVTTPQWDMLPVDWDTSLGRVTVTCQFIGSFPAHARVEAIDIFFRVGESAPPNTVENCAFIINALPGNTQSADGSLSKLTDCWRTGFCLPCTRD